MIPGVLTILNCGVKYLNKLSKMENFHDIFHIMGKFVEKSR